MSRLVIAEKPSVAEDISRVVGPSNNLGTHWLSPDGTVITFAVGSLVSLAPPERYDPKFKFWNIRDLPILPKKYIWEPKDARAQTRLNEISDLLKKYPISSVVNACDAAREGEYIFRLIWAELGMEGKYTQERAWIRSMTDEGIKKAFNAIQPSDKFRPLAMAAAARSIADWSVGINGSRAISSELRKSGNPKETWSVGRVQTPTLAIIADYEATRRAAKPHPNYQLMLCLSNESDSFLVPHALITPDAEKLKSLRSTLKGQPVVPTVQKTEVLKPAPKLFDLTTLQRFMNTTQKWTAARTLKAAQSLYEREKVLTYPRTDSTALPSDYEAEVPGILTQLIRNGDISDVPDLEKTNRAAVYNDAEVTDHFAIIPTGQKLLSRDPDGVQLYQTIVKRFVAALSEPEKVALERQVYKVGTEEFALQKETTLEPGWRGVYGRTAGHTVGKLPVFSPEVELVGIKTDTKLDMGMPPMTEAKLLESMCEDPSSKLGTPATRANIIEELKTKTYINGADGSVTITEKGDKLIDHLKFIGLDTLTSPKLTGEWEAKLVLIEQGKLTLPQFLEESRQLTKQVTQQILHPSNGPEM